jgi:hypothetical protein
MRVMRVALVVAGRRDPHVHPGGPVRRRLRGPLNQPLGLTGPPAADCSTVLTTTALAPGRSRTLTSLAPGVHRYQCMIHPWMRSTITVR